MFLWKREPVCFWESRKAFSSSAKSNGTFLKEITLPRSSWSQYQLAWSGEYVSTSTRAARGSKAFVAVIRTPYSVPWFSVQSYLFSFFLQRWNVRTGHNDGPAEARF